MQNVNIIVNGIETAEWELQDVLAVEKAVEVVVDGGTAAQRRRAQKVVDAALVEAGFASAEWEEREAPAEPAVELLQDAGLDEAEAEAVAEAGVEPANEDEAAAVVEVVAAAAQAVQSAAEADDVTGPGAWEPEGKGVEIGTVEAGRMVRSKSGRLVIVVGPSEEEATSDGRIFSRAGARTVIDHITEVGIVRGVGVAPSTLVWPLTEAEQAYEAALAGAVERRVNLAKEAAAARTEELQRREERKAEKKAEKQAEKQELAAKVAEGGSICGSRKVSGSLQQQIKYLAALKVEKQAENGVIFVPRAEFEADPRPTNNSKNWPSAWHDDRLVPYKAVLACGFVQGSLRKDGLYLWEDGAEIQKSARSTSEPKAPREPKIKGERDSRLPVAGTILVVKNKKHADAEVTVLESGFEYAGQYYKSLSAVAKVATGESAINGYLWAGLTSR